MKTIAIIPARYASTRFPGKLMKDLCGKTVILRTYEATINANLFDDVYLVTDSDKILNELKTGRRSKLLFDDVYVVTDSDIILNEIIKNGGKAIKSIKIHESGSDRIAEALKILNIDADIVVNVQGDEPFIDVESLRKLIDIFKTDTKKEIDLASLMIEIKDEEEINNPNNVKVVVDQNGFALYFSRARIPYLREKYVGVKYFKHIGVYAFRKQALMDFPDLDESMLEASEKLEQLRYLENGKRIKMVITTHVGIGIDTVEDLERARVIFKQ